MSSLFSGSLSRLAFSDETLVKERDYIRHPAKSAVLQYIIVRDDLGMSKGKIAAQAAHAAVECYRKLVHRIMTESMLYGKDNKYYYTKIHNLWASTGTKKVILNGGSISKIEALISSLDDSLIIHQVIDQGLTEVEPDTLTCVGVGPGYATDLSPLFADLEIL